jgi:hypothetical protein
MARRGNYVSICYHQKGLQSQVNPRGRQWGRRDLSIRQLARTDDVPANRITLERDRLDRAFNKPVQFDVDVPDVLEGDPRSLQLAAIAVRRQLHGIEAVLPP